ncbi:DNA-3-methyladenine glycosylase [Nocardioides marmoriginsengisoli]|uniref:Putative 3-methyladenine DNA glycosylase n=1 Tax=Nocardioides marmoriginsengisoli TaxID=661483 RepID=A0A3N0CK19_9ACTN|nr:DNA-3-methyladenine glycosylase [Nocardioides marmoriginsengisoli]RNL63797.1 DNA-3-methyladenine glycosylase [Nocardioides marmoriginsengisoli]
MLLADALAGPVLEVAPRLLGATLRHGDVAVRITEVEAYDGPNDPGSHAFRGPTPRNRVMFGPPGFLYVYFVYGMHHCANVVCGPEGTASAVLLRAGEIAGAEPSTARGPAKLCRALGLDREQSGADLVAGPVTLTLGEPVEPARIATGPRVGLRLAAENPWRFWIEGDPTVSRYVPAKPARDHRRSN